MRNFKYMPEHDNIFFIFAHICMVSLYPFVDIKVFITVGINVHNNQTDNNVIDAYWITCPDIYMYYVFHVIDHTR